LIFIYVIYRWALFFDTIKESEKISFKFLIIIIIILVLSRNTRGGGEGRRVS